MSIRRFPKLSEVIEKASSLVAVQLAKSQSMSMRLCQCLKLVIATGSSGLSAGMLEFPLFFPRASPDNVLSPPHSHWRAVADEPVVLYSRLSGDWPGSVQHSGSDRASTSLCIEPDTSDPSQETIFPGCLPLPEGSENVLASIADDRPDHHQTVWTLPVSKRVMPVNTTISETSEETSVLLLPCDHEPCVVWDYGGRVRLLDLAEMTLPGESGAAERETRKVRNVVQTRDQDGNIVYQWYDQDGHLHTISEWEYKRRLSLYFQSWLEFLYPEYFGSSIPAGGGWHQWQYWKIRRTADRPENTDPQQWPDRQARHQPDGKTTRSVAAVQPIPEDRSTRYQSRHQNSWPQSSPSGRDIGRNDENDIDQLLMEFESGYIQEIAARHNENYDGREHGQYCSQIKNATRIRRKPLTDDEKLRFIPFMRHLSEVIHSFNGMNLGMCIHSLVASQLLYPPHSTQEPEASLDGEGGSVKKAQKVLIEEFIRTIESRATLQKKALCGFDTQAISDLQWSLAQLVQNGRLQPDQVSLASQEDSKDMTCVPNELVVKILSNLGTRDISVCRSVNRTWKELIDNSHLQARSFCLDCPPPAVLYSLQKAVERYSSSIRDWLTGFSDKGKKSVEQLDQLLEVKYFPEELFFSIAKTLAQAKSFLCKNTGAIQPTGGVDNISFSPDGTYLVIVSFDKTATIWRLIDGQWQKKATIHHTDWVNNASFSPDGYHLVTASRDNTAKIWELVDSQWQEKATIQHTDWVNNASFSPDGYHLLTASADHTAKIRGLVDGQWQEKTTIQHTGWVKNASFSPDGYHLVTVSHNIAKIWGLVDGQWQENTTIQHTDWVKNASFSPGGNHLVTISYHIAKIWGLVDGQWQEKATIQHTGWVKNASFSPDRYHLVTASVDYTAKIWRLVDGQWQENTTIQHTNWVNSASFSPDGYHLVTASGDYTVTIMGLVGGKWLKKATIQHTDWVNSASFSPDGYHLVTVSGFNTVKIWILKSNSCFDLSLSCVIF